MKKKLAAFILMLCLVASCVSAYAFAEGDTSLSVTGMSVSTIQSENGNNYEIFFIEFSKDIFAEKGTDISGNEALKNGIKINDIPLASLSGTYMYQGSYNKAHGALNIIEVWLTPKRAEDYTVTVMQGTSVGNSVVSETVTFYKTGEGFLSEKPALTTEIKSISSMKNEETNECYIFIKFDSVATDGSYELDSKYFEKIIVNGQTLSALTGAKVYATWQAPAADNNYLQLQVKQENNVNKVLKFDGTDNVEILSGLVTQSGKELTNGRKFFLMTNGNFVEKMNIVSVSGSKESATSDLNIFVKFDKDILPGTDKAAYSATEAEMDNMLFNGEKLSDLKKEGKADASWQEPSETNKYLWIIIKPTCEMLEKNENTIEIKQGIINAADLLVNNSVKKLYLDDTQQFIDYEKAGDINVKEFSLYKNYKEGPNQDIILHYLFIKFEDYNNGIEYIGAEPNSDYFALNYIKINNKTISEIRENNKDLSNPQAIEINWFVDQENNGYIRLSINPNLTGDYGFKFDGKDKVEVLEGMRTPNGYIIENTFSKIYNDTNEFWTNVVDTNVTFGETSVEGVTATMLSDENSDLLTITFNDKIVDAESPKQCYAHINGIAHVVNAQFGANAGNNSYYTQDIFDKFVCLGIKDSPLDKILFDNKSIRELMNKEGDDLLKTYSIAVHYGNTSASDYAYTIQISFNKDTRYHNQFDYLQNHTLEILSGFRTPTMLETKTNAKFFFDSASSKWMGFDTQIDSISKLSEEDGKMVGYIYFLQPVASTESQITTLDKIKINKSTFEQLNNASANSATGKFVLKDNKYVLKFEVAKSAFTLDGKDTISILAGFTTPNGFTTTTDCQKTYSASHSYWYSPSKVDIMNTTAQNLTTLTKKANGDITFSIKLAQSVTDTRLRNITGDLTTLLQLSLNGETGYYYNDRIINNIINLGLIEGILDNVIINGKTVRFLIAEEANCLNIDLVDDTFVITIKSSSKFTVSDLNAFKVKVNKGLVSYTGYKTTNDLEFIFNAKDNTWVAGSKLEEVPDVPSGSDNEDVKPIKKGCGSFNFDGVSSIIVVSILSALVIMGFSKKKNN